MRIFCKFSCTNCLFSHRFKRNDSPFYFFQDNPQKQNGIVTEENGSNAEKPASQNGVSGNHPEKQHEQEEMKGDDGKLNDKPLENGDIEKEETAENDRDSVSAKTGETPVVLSDDPESNAVGNTRSPVIVNSDASQDGENSSEAMEVDSKDDDDSNVVELSSNVSAPNSDVVEVDDNNSNNPSVISEESSRDSVDSNESIKSGNSSESKRQESLVGTVKDDDGDEILITLNDEDEKEKTDEDMQVVEEMNKSKEKNEQLESQNNENIGENKDTDNKEKVNTEEKKACEEVSKSTPAAVHPSATSTTSSISAATTLLFPVSAGPVLNSPQSIVVQGTVPSVRAEYQLIRQGNQLGYISIVGNQRIFVPVSTAVQAAAVPKNQMIVNQLSAVPQQSQKKVSPPVKAEDLLPKASWEMIELMKWEIQNRIPDNFNWSVAFHPRKEEVSSVTSFLQELGSDVVKEQVYKDIIQIQTKKKDAGDLKEPEIESLEKMKTVYENTKKKVEHLQLETKECKNCNFKTESSVVMNYHNDFPHYDPPWDTNKGWLLCAHCDFKTKTPVQFIFHQKDVHNVQAKFLEKNNYFHCSLCPLSVSTKSKLEKHQQKCMKHFKLNANLQPYYHDVNFCMKTCYYKPKKVVPKPPPPPPPKPVVAKPTMLTRQQGSVIVTQPVSQPNQAIRPNDAIRQRLPLVRGPMPQQNLQRPQVQQPRPRLNPPALQRAPIQQQQKPLRPAGKEMSGFEVCELCGGYVKDRQALRIHFYYAHKVEMPQAIFNRPTPPLTCDVCKQHYWTTQGLTKHKSAQRHFIGARPPVTSAGKIAPEQECFMCLKRFPNLFVHFERIHGMTMKDLVLVRKCIMCGLAATDYKALETHLVHAHGVLIKVNDYVNDRSKPVKPPSTSPAVISGGKNVGKINYCVFCQVQFPDNIQLTMHCIRSHATCRTCGMVVATNKNLADHSCSKAHINRSCYICGAKVASQEKYASHLRSHVKPCRVKIQNMTAEEIDEVRTKIKREYKPAVISLDSDEDSDVEVVETKPSKMKVVLEKEESKDVEMVDLSDATNEKSVCKTDTAGQDDQNDQKSEVIAKLDKEIESKSDDKSKEESGKDKTCENQNQSEIGPREVENSEGPGNVKTDKAENESSNESEINTAEESGKKSEISTELNRDDDSNIRSSSGLDKAESENDADIQEKTENANQMKSDSGDSVANEKELDDKLLEMDDDEDSVKSTGSRKRKKSESDIDEDELLRDDTNDSKRIKTEDKNDIDDNALNEQADSKNEAVKPDESKCVQDIEMGETLSTEHKKTEEI